MLSTEQPVAPRDAALPRSDPIRQSASPLTGSFSLHKRLHSLPFFVAHQMQSHLPEVKLSNAALPIPKESLIQVPPGHIIEDPALPCTITEPEPTGFPDFSDFSHVCREDYWKDTRLLRTVFGSFPTGWLYLQTHFVRLFPVINAGRPRLSQVEKKPPWRV